MLQLPGAKDHVVEFHSLSKTFNMTGWRVGFAIGGAPMVGALGQVKSNTDSGIFTAIQFAAKTALDEYDDDYSSASRHVQGTTRRVHMPRASKIELVTCPTPEATFYMWIPCPVGYTSTEPPAPSSLMRPLSSPPPASASAPPPRDSSAPP